MLLYSMHYDDGESTFAVNRLFTDQLDFDEFIADPIEPIASYEFICDFELDDTLVQVID